MNELNYTESNGFFFHVNTNSDVRTALAQAFASRSTVRIWFGDIVTGRAWAEENDVLGKVGRSTGRIKVPLLVEPGEDCGGHMLDHCIVRIDVVKRRSLRSDESRVDGTKARSVLEGATVYSHLSFHTGNWEVRESDTVGFASTVTLDGQIHARFINSRQAPKFVSFMRGESYFRV